MLFRNRNDCTLWIKCSSMYTVWEKIFNLWTFIYQDIQWSHCSYFNKKITFKNLPPSAQMILPLKCKCHNFNWKTIISCSFLKYANMSHLQPCKLHRVYYTPYCKYNFCNKLIAIWNQRIYPFWYSPNKGILLLMQY